MFNDLSYLPFKESVVLHLKKNLESVLPKHGLFQVWLKSAQWLWRRSSKCKTLQTERQTERRTEGRRTKNDLKNSLELSTQMSLNPFNIVNRDETKDSFTSITVYIYFPGVPVNFKLLVVVNECLKEDQLFLLPITLQYTFCTLYNYCNHHKRCFPLAIQFMNMLTN